MQNLQVSLISWFNRKKRREWTSNSNLFISHCKSFVEYCWTLDYCFWKSSCTIFSYGLLCVFFSSKRRAEEWRRVASYFECIRKLAAALCLSFCLHLFKTFDVKDGEEKATFLKSSSGNVGPCNATTHILRNWILTESFAPQVSTSYGVKKRSNYKQGYFQFEEITLKSAY